MPAGILKMDEERNMANDEPPKLRWYTFRWGVLFWIVVIFLFFRNFDAIQNWAVAVFGQ